MKLLILLLCLVSYASTVPTAQAAPLSKANSAIELAPAALDALGDPTVQNCAFSLSLCGPDGCIVLPPVVVKATVIAAVVVVAAKLVNSYEGKRVQRAIKRAFKGRRI